MTERGFYKVKDEFFIEFPDPYLKENKKEHRPCYFVFRDRNTQLLWMIPLSSKTEKYQNIINKRLEAGRPCDILHICKLDSGTRSVFLIQDMFPIVDEYIASEYTIAGNHLKLTSDTESKIIEQKANRVLNMIRRGVKFTPTQPDVLAIEKELLSA